MKHNSLFFIDLVFPKLFSGADKFLASSKARDDIKTILMQRDDVVYVPIKRNFRSKLIGNLELLLKLLCKLILMKKGSDLFLQYPMGNLSIFRLLSPVLSKLNTTIIVHDLPTFRFPNEYDNREKEILVLNNFSSVIVHTVKMKDILVKNGVKSNLVVLSAFDYLVNDREVAKNEKNTIVFAGDLKKSVFLKDLHMIDFGEYNFNLYGGYKPDIEYADFIRYEGAFAPNNISSIKGEWGLLWDGDSVNDCIGNFGEYLKIIAPHKFSLYLACGFKVIAWKGSAMADFIINEKIGFVVNSLSEIKDTIYSLSEEEKNEISKNVLKWSERIRHGEMFSSAFKNVQKYE